MKPAEQQLQQRLARIEGLIEEIDRFADPAARSTAKELAQTMLDFYGAGLERMLDITYDASADGPAIIEALAEDDLVRSLMLLHGLHPLDLATRVGQALEKVRPYLASHGGNVELLGVDDGLIRLRLQGSCNGCASSAVTLKLAIEEALHEYAPDAAGLKVEGVVEPPPPRANFIPLTAVGGPRRDAPANGGNWQTVDGISSLADGALRAMDVSGAPVLFARIGDTLYAYAGACPGCGQLLGQAKLKGKDLVCADCGQRFDVMRAGRGLDQPSLHLEPFPLLEAQGRVKIALSASATVG